MGITPTFPFSPSLEPENFLLGIKLILEDHELSVYVDRYNDPQLSTTAVDQETAQIIKKRMRQSNTLLYVHSQYSKKSRWMPWELGFFDGLKGKVGVIPIVGENSSSFKNEEFLNLYPYIDTAKGNGGSKKLLWINASETNYANFGLWARGKDAIKMH